MAIDHQAPSHRTSPTQASPHVDNISPQSTPQTLDPARLLLLRELAVLREQGILSDAEFCMEKRQILAR